MSVFNFAWGGGGCVLEMMDDTMDTDNKGVPWEPWNTGVKRGIDCGEEFIDLLQSRNKHLKSAAAAADDDDGDDDDDDGDDDGDDDDDDCCHVSICMWCWRHSLVVRHSKMLWKKYNGCIT